MNETDKHILVAIFFGAIVLAVALCLIQEWIDNRRNSRMPKCRDCGDLATTTRSGGFDCVKKQRIVIHLCTRDANDHDQVYDDYRREMSADWAS